MKYLFGGLITIWLVTIVYAGQQLYIGPTTDADIRWAKKADFDGSILFCRGQYTADRIEENGTGWFTDYPGADNNFLVRLSELTLFRVKFEKDRIPIHVVLALNDPLLFRCPILIMEDVGVIAFRDDEVRMLIRYFHQGGFLWVDDFWGSEAWDQWEREIRRVLPSGLYRMIDIPLDHPILHQIYDVKEVPQMSTVGLWEDGIISERGDDSATVHFRGILDDKGRIIVVMTHNTDISDGYEDRMDSSAGVSFEYSQKYSSLAYAIGIDIWLYAITH